MLVFSAITPHPPILIPTIGQENTKKLKKTSQAMRDLAEEFYAASPEVVILIASHENLLDKAFTLNTSPEYHVNFKEFGDLETELTFSGDIGLSHQIKESVETKIPLQMFNQQNLEHSYGVPLYFLQPAEELIHPKSSIKNIKIIPLGCSNLNNSQHFEFGQALANLIYKSDKRIAIIASANLADSSAKNFDQELINSLKQKNHSEIIKTHLPENDSDISTGLKSILILLGILSEQNYTLQILSYENPLGTGYLVCNFDLK